MGWFAQYKCELDGKKKTGLNLYSFITLKLAWNFVCSVNSSYISELLNHPLLREYEHVVFVSISRFTMPNWLAPKGNLDVSLAHFLFRFQYYTENGLEQVRVT